MPFKPTKEEQKLIDEVTQKQKDLDVEFFLRTMANRIVEQSHGERIDLVTKIIQTVALICRESAEHATRDALKRDDITVDETVDAVREFMESATLLQQIVSVIEVAAEEDDDGPFGILTMDQDESNKHVERIRMTLIRAKAQRRAAKRGN